jgi:hypothetical protein
METTPFNVFFCAKLAGYAQTEKKMGSPMREFFHRLSKNFHFPHTRKDLGNQKKAMFRYPGVGGISFQKNSSGKRRSKL